LGQKPSSPFRRVSDVSFLTSDLSHQRVSLVRENLASIQRRFRDEMLAQKTAA
jgi:hypothetical protein